MTRNSFKHLIHEKSSEASFRYLLSLRKTKGSEITYTKLSMANYLSPNNKMSITQKQQIFAIRNRMIYTNNNFPNMNIDPYCICGNLETNKHLYTCEFLNSGKRKGPYTYIFSDNISEITHTYEVISKSLKIREQTIELFSLNNNKRKYPRDPV